MTRQVPLRAGRQAAVGREPRPSEDRQEPGERGGAEPLAQRRGAEPDGHQRHDVVDDRGARGPDLGDEHRVDEQRARGAGDDEHGQ